MAKNTFGTQIQISASAITGSTGKLTNCTSIGFPNPSQGTIDTTSHDSAGGIATYLADGIIKFQPLKAVLQVAPGDTIDAACNAAATAGVPYFVKITANGASAAFTYSFQAIVTGWDLADAQINGIYEGTLSLQPTGAVTRA